MPFATREEAVRAARRVLPHPPWVVIAATEVTGTTGPAGGTWLVDANVHHDPYTLWKEFRRNAPIGRYYLWATTAGNPHAPITIIDSDLLDRAYGAKAVQR